MSELPDSKAAPTPPEPGAPTPDKQQALEIKELGLRVQILESDRWQKKYLWPLGNSTAVIALIGLGYSMISGVTLQDQNRALNSKIDAAKKTLTQYRADADEELVKVQNLKKDLAVVQAQMIDAARKVEKQKGPTEDSNAFRRVAAEASVAPLPNSKATPLDFEIKPLIESLFQPTGKAALQTLIKDYSEAPNLIDLAAEACFRNDHQNSISGITNVVDLMMYIPRYRVRPKIDYLKRIAELGKKLSAGGNERLRYDLQLLTDRIDRIETTGKG